MTTQYTPEERQAYAKRLTEELNHKVLNMAEKWERNPAELTEFLQFKSRFPTYSWRNTALIYEQNPHALFATSYTRYKEMGYYVKKGSHGMSILCPTPREFYRTNKQAAWKPLYSATDEIRALAKAGAIETYTKMQYRPAWVYDISQTSCPRSDYPKLVGLGYDSDYHAKMADAARMYAESLGMPCVELDTPGATVRGLYNPQTNEICISRLLGDTQRLSTLLHEMSHGILEHAGVGTVAQREFEADALSIMLGSSCGLEVSEARQAHLAEAYRVYREEWAEGETIYDKLQVVNDRYMEHIEPLKECFAEALKRERAMEQAVGEQPKRISPPSENYRLLQKLSPEFMNKTYSYVRLECAGLEPLTLEWIGNNEVAIMHTYVQNGDLMRDPEITARVDSRGKIVQPLSYRQDALGIYQEVGRGTDVNLALRRDMNITLSKMLINAEQGGYSPAVATRILLNGNEEEVTFEQSPMQDAVQIPTKPPTTDTRLFLDMDGTLARFHDHADCLERMWEPEFFRNLEPFNETVQGVRQFIAAHPDVEVYILSSVIEGEPPSTIAQKNAWLDEHIPEVDKAHRLFPAVGESKIEAVPNGIRPDDILLDDYNHNLEEWQAAGGHAVKFVNNINDRGLIGALWEGDRIYYNRPSQMQLEETIYDERTVTATTEQAKQTVVVNMFAGPGAGKTTCAWEIAEKLKKLGYVVEYVPEYAKELVWDNDVEKLDGTVEHQRVLCEEQAHRVNRLLGKVDFVITDSPVLLNLSYLSEPSASYEKEVLACFQNNNNFNIFIERGETFEQQGRIQNAEQSAAIDEQVKGMLSKYGIYYGTYHHNTVDLCIRNMQVTHARLNPSHAEPLHDETVNESQPSEGVHVPPAATVYERLASAANAIGYPLPETPPTTPQDTERMASSIGGFLFRRACPDMPDEQACAAGAALGHRLLARYGVDTGDTMTADYDKIVTTLSPEEQQKMQLRLQNGENFLVAKSEPMPAEKDLSISSVPKPSIVEETP